VKKHGVEKLENEEAATVADGDPPLKWPDLDPPVDVKCANEVLVKPRQQGAPAIEPDKTYDGLSSDHHGWREQSVMQQQSGPGQCAAEYRLCKARSRYARYEAAAFHEGEDGIDLERHA